jgi:beta-lactamase superfamily II metal-dependent hydrolase
MIRYVSAFKTNLCSEQGERLATLLWGDPVRVLDVQGARTHVKARRQDGWIDTADLGDTSLLEIYVIDVGQGDGVLFKTPDGKWHLIDAGVSNGEQMLKKGVSNFLHWKFIEEIGGDSVALESVIVTHPDFDHYGGLVDVFAGQTYEPDISTGEQKPQKAFDITVENLYHSGLAKFAKAPTLGARVAGTVAPFPQGGHGVQPGGQFITEMLDDQASFQAPPRALSKSFAEFARLAAQVPRHVRRLSYLDGHLPGYGPGQNAATIRVLGPVLETFAGQSGLRVLDSDSRTVNGHSVVLRLDYGQARILLTGDLNAGSQALLLSYHPAGEFAVDVAKSCHHGSEDVNIEFLKAIKARATVISSGDSEDYAHPRPLVVGAAGMYGRAAKSTQGATLPPLVYSTELSRSHLLRNVVGAQHFTDPQDRKKFEQLPVRDLKLVPELTEQEQGEKQPPRPRWLAYCPVATRFVYGLVNVRTDGQLIMCATMLEKGNDFDVKVFRAGVDVPGP